MKVGVIGLGAMGANMALNFHYAGFLHRIWNRTRAKAEAAAAKTSVTIADTPQQLAAECELIITCVSRDADVLEMVRAISATIKPDAIVADTSTISAATARQAAAILADKHAHFLDCPVSGGVEGARNGTLAIMAGGDEKMLERARSALSAIASNIAYIGPSGSGQACKAVNQLMAAGINQAVTEALAFGELMGLDMNKVVDIVAAGAAGNWYLDHRGKSLL
ncbi:MAG: NAD(P)-dependent oxidoreductase, partial [Gammaproteobacteria bacterium]